MNRAGHLAEAEAMMKLVSQWSGGSRRNQPPTR